MKVRRLSIKDLQRSEQAFMYYQRHYNFMYASHHSGSFINIPVLEKTSANLEKIPPEYFEGFIHEYNKPMPMASTECGREWILRLILPDPKYLPDLDKFPQPENFFDLGCTTAQAYKAWEYIISDLPDFEKYFTGKAEKPSPSFESLFRNPDNAKEVKRILELENYTSEGVWQGSSGNKTELLAAYYVLKPLLKGTKNTPQATLFYQEFGLNVGEYIDPRSLRNEPFNEDQEQFERIFAHILPPK